MSLFDVLPPSPPTTTSRKATADGLPPFTAPPILMSTPEDSPASMPGSSNQGSRKKVEFCAQPNIYDAAVFGSGPEQAASVKPLPPSRQHRLGRRSILKPPSQPEVPLGNMDGQQEEKLSVNENMDSIVQQLSKNDKPTSLDAYNTLASLFRAYDELPEAIVLKNKLSTLIKYIRRDLASQDRADEEPTDTNLILSALKLLIILVWNQAYCPLLSDEARIFILDRSLHVISEHRASKNIIVHYLHLLTVQNFRPPMMAANNRAGRLLDALKELPEHVSSSAAVSETIMVLSRLTDQAKPVMKAKADCWVETLLKTMVTTSRDTRQKAISFGMKACSAFAGAPSVSAAFRDMLKRETDTNTTMEASACKRLKAMFAKTEDAVLVPQIWATVLLLSVNTSENVDDWTSLRSCWLEVIQRCFNTSDTAVRIQANFAWNRLVCLARPHEASDSVAVLLGKPVAGQMERSGRDKQGHDSRISALSGYCNLLYYAFRPAATHKQYTRSWNEYIVKVLRSSFFGRNTTNPDFACRIFMALTWNSTRVTKVWKDTRAHDNATVEPEELPTIDAKWLRKNCGTVLQIFKLLFTHSTWCPSNTSDQSHVTTAWKHFAKSLGDAASKEIKASSETVQACVQVVGLVQELWQEGSRAVNAGDGDFDILADRLRFLLRAVIAELGAAPFIDVLDSGTIHLPAALLQTFASTAVEMRHILHGTDNQLGGAYLPSKPGASALLLLEKTLTLLDDRLNDAYQASNVDCRDLDSALELLSSCLRDAPEHIVVLTLRTMHSSLQLWLEDRNRSFTVTEVFEIARVDMAKKIAGVVVPCLGTLPNHMVKYLDGLFAAGFSSTHKETINQMVDIWNITHGQASQMIYGPILIAALKRLRPYVDIKLVDPPLPDDLHLPKVSESNAPPAFLEYIEFQSEPLEVDLTEKNVETIEHPQSHIRCDDDLITQAAAKAAVPAQNIGEITNSRPQSSHSTPQRIRRHNDSQLHFQPIDSSPLTEMQEESQHLTDRQKEVRDRQRQDASVYFPDLKADVAPKPAQNTISTGELGRRALLGERTSTPTLSGRGLADFDSNPTASPTPRTKHQALRLEDIEAPSSPLSVQAEDDGVAQETTGVDVSEAGGAEDAQTSLAEEDVHTEDGPATTSSELLPNSPERKEPLDEVVENAHQNDLGGLVNGVVQNVNNALHDGPKLSPPDLESGAEADSTTRKEAEAASLSDHGQANLFSPHNIRVASSPPRLNSDELDMMSQSQLSQDLESHVSEPSNTPEPISAIGKRGFDEEATRASSATASQRKRKRGSGLYAGSKRRKSRSLSRSVSDASQDQQEEVVYDCIEVDTSSRVPLTEFWASKRQSAIATLSQRVGSTGSSNSNTNTNLASHGTRLKKTSADVRAMLLPTLLISSSSAISRGLPEDPTTGPRAITEPSSYITNLAEEESKLADERVIAEFDDAGTESMQETIMPSDLPEAVTKDSTAQKPSDATSDAATGIHEHALETEEAAVQTLSAPQQHVGVQTETKIMASLQDVLELLKKSTGEGLDLRAIDDLCFHIRSEGQNASSRWARH